MEEIDKIKRGFALEGIDNSMVSIMRRLVHRWFSGSVVGGENDVDVDNEARHADKAG